MQRLTFSHEQSGTILPTESGKNSMTTSKFRRKGKEGEAYVKVHCTADMQRHGGEARQTFVNPADICRARAQETLAAYRRHRGELTLPIPVEDLAVWLGFQVVMLTSVPEEFSALVSTRERLIGINGRHHHRRQRFSICHELAHILLNHPPESSCTPQQIMRYNIEADECAAELLMPSDLLARWYALTRNVREMARIFDVSEEAMRRKIAQVFPASGATGARR